MAVVRRRDDCIHKPVCVECGAISCPAECGHYIKVEKFTSYNSAMLEIALCVQRVFTIVNQGAMGKFCDLESDINAVVAQLQQ